MKRILVLDGGGAKGLIQSAILAQVERKLGKRCHELFDLIVGTSVGAVAGALLASGKVTAHLMHEQMKATIPALFKRRFWPPRYRRDALIKVFNHEVGEGFRMNQCRTKFMCTSVNMVDGRTHYFKSWEPADGVMGLLDAVNRSYAAPLYFGSLVDEQAKAVWLDGGTGNENCPIVEAVVETVRQEWLGNEDVHLFSLGTGWHETRIPFGKAKRYRTIRQVLYYMQPVDGGLARNQAVKSRVEQVLAIAKVLDNFSMQRLDKIIDEKMDRLDGVRYMDEYERIGNELGAEVDYTPLTAQPVLVGV